MDKSTLITKKKLEVVDTSAMKQSIYFYMRSDDLKGVDGVNLTTNMTAEKFTSTLRLFEKRMIQNLLVPSNLVTGWRVNSQNNVEIVMLGDNWTDEEIAQAKHRSRTFN